MDKLGWLTESTLIPEKPKEIQIEKKDLKSIKTLTKHKDPPNLQNNSLFKKLGDIYKKKKRDIKEETK